MNQENPKLSKDKVFIFDLLLYKSLEVVAETEEEARQSLDWTIAITGMRPVETKLVDSWQLIEGWETF